MHDVTALMRRVEKKRYSNARRMSHWDDGGEGGIL